MKGVYLQLYRQFPQHVEHRKGSEELIAEHAIAIEERDRIYLGQASNQIILQEEEE